MTTMFTTPLLIARIGWSCSQHREVVRVWRRHDKSYIGTLFQERLPPRMCRQMAEEWCKLADAVMDIRLEARKGES